MNNNDNSIDRKNHVYEFINHMPFKDKLIHAKKKIEEFLKWCEKDLYSNNNSAKEVLVSFSGGKDSTVLLDIVINVHKKINSKLKIIPAYAIEITFPETIKFIKDIVANYQKDYEYISNPLLVPPKKPWVYILREKGYPIFSKQISVQINRLKRLNKKTGLAKWAFGIEESARFKLSKSRLFLLDKEMTYYLDENNNKIQYDFSEKCCDYVKGGLKHDKRPSFVGTMASESLLRKKSWIKSGCNVFSNKHPMSRPLSLWNSNNVWEYIKTYNIKVNEAYGYEKNKHNIDELRFSRLGCTACPLGSYIEELVHEKMIDKNEKISSNKKYWNRFEKLYEYNYNLYISQIKKTGIEHILMDMNIKIRNDSEYMEKFFKRRQKIKEWYDDFKNNFIKILIGLEFYENRKENWQYSYDEINKALRHFKEKELTKKEIEFIKKYRNKLSNKK